MKYEEAAKRWGVRHLETECTEFDEVLRVSFTSEYEEGCPTCGGTSYVEAYIYYRIGTKRQSSWFRVDLDTILKELFEVSE